MRMRDKRQKDNEELELESCFSELKQKAGIEDDEIEKLANQSLTDLKEMQNQKSQQSFYKPQLMSSTPNLKTAIPKKPPQGQAPDWKTYAKRNSNVLKPNLNQSQPQIQGSERMDAIYAQLRNLQALKDDIMGDLNDFLDDEETKSVQLSIAPEKMDQIVDIVVSDSRAKASENLDEPAAYGKVMERMGLGEKEEKPFWAKFISQETS